MTVEQRKLTTAAIRDLADRYQWTLHAIAAMSDHVHVVIGAAREGEPLRDAIKAVASRALSKRYGKRTWWAVGGSCKYLWERDYFVNAVYYVQRQEGL